MYKSKVFTHNQIFMNNALCVKSCEILKRIEVDRAVLFGLLARIWGLGSDEQINLAVKSLEDGSIGRAIIEY